VALTQYLGVSPPSGLEIQVDEFRSREAVVRLSAHLPQNLLVRLLGDQDPLRAISGPCVAIIGDIRQSQDLLTYARSVDDYAKRMAEFVEIIGVLVRDFDAVFDKFTGDGFVLYLSEAISGGPADLSLHARNLFVNISACTRQLFSDWVETIGKRPITEVGLAVGADYGVIEFREVDRRFVAVGECIVWASRMCDKAAAGEVVCNNRLRKLLALQRCSFEDVEGRTKSGEGFIAGKLRA
jgi:class 3 adenylate cyclase